MMAGTDANPYDIPLGEIDVSNPRLYRDDTIGAYFERLRKDALWYISGNRDAQAVADPESVHHRP